MEQRRAAPAKFMDIPFHSGFVAILGRPNAGKSTFVNQLVGQKVAIVTSRPQTTLSRVLGIVNRPHAQVVLIDTPGVHRAESALGRQMMEEVAQALEGIDVLAVMIDASAGITRADRLTFQRAENFRGPRILLLNAEMIPISALSGDGVGLALERFIAHLPEGEPNFPEDQVTDQPQRFLAAEIVREKAMEATRNEVPHAVAVLIDSFEEGERLTRISATIHVEREGQKGILIGRRGEMLKEIGTAARKELEEILGMKVFLELHVKVQPAWREDPRRVRELDWRRQMERLSGE